MKHACLSSISIEKKSYKNISYDQVVKQYPFPKKYHFLLLRWLLPNASNEKHKFKSLNNSRCDVNAKSIFGSSIANLLVSNALPINIFKKKSKQKL